MQPRHENYAAKVKSSFAKQSMLSAITAEIIEVSAGHVTITARNHPQFCQQQGFAHAAIPFALGDSAAGYAALSLMEEDQEVVTSEMKIHLLSPVMGDRLLAKGRVIRAGKRQIIAAASVWVEQTDGPAKHVAELMGTMVPVKSG